VAYRNNIHIVLQMGLINLYLMFKDFVLNAVVKYKNVNINSKLCTVF
jgi:hypothetical protein